MTYTPSTTDLSCIKCRDTFHVLGETEAKRNEAIGAWRGCDDCKPTPIFAPDAWQPGPVVVLVLGLLLAVVFVAALVVDVIART